MHTALQEEKAELEKEKEKLRGKINEYESKIKEIEEEKKEQTRKFQKEIKEWEKSKEKNRHKTRDIEKQKEPLFVSLGKIIDELRVDNKKLAIIYSQIDMANKSIQEIEKNLKNL